MNEQGRKNFEYQLQYPLSEWARMSTTICANNTSHKFLFKVKEEPQNLTKTATVNVNLDGFNADYQAKYISGKIEYYIMKLLGAIERTMFSALLMQGVDDYCIHFRFRYNGQQYDRTVKYYYLTKVS